MQLRIALAVVVFAVAGAAVAQDAGMAPGVPPPPPLIFTIPELDNFQRSETMAASHQVHLACAADMQTLCGSKAGAAADRCLVYHRPSFSAGCRRAITGFERAAAPIGAADTLAGYHPYSRYQTRAGPPAKGWRPIPASPEPPAATGA